MIRITIILSISMITQSVLANDIEIQSCPSPYDKYFDSNNNLESNTYIINSDQSSLTRKNDFELNGNVEISSKEYFFGADKVIIDSDNKKLYGENNVKFENNFIHLNANKLDIENDLISGEETDFSLKNFGINGSSKKIVAEEKKQTFENVQFSSCPNYQKDWMISANKLDIDEDKNIGIVNDLTLRFMDIPIFYAPYLELPLKGRASGFLTPSFATYIDNNLGSSEEKINIPYYLNIAPNKDLLIDTDYLTSRGLNLGTKYRQLVSKSEFYDSGKISLDNRILFSDKVSLKDRWLSKNNLEIEIDSSSKIRANTYKVSDANYFNEVLQNNSEKNLISSLSYNYEKNDLFLGINYENEQILEGGTSSYLNNPEINIEKKINYNNNLIDLSLTGSKLKNKNLALIQGKKFHSENSIRREIFLNNLSIRPKLSLLNSKYQISNNENHSRSLTKLNVEIDTDLERKISSKNGDIFIQTFTPKLAYNFVENKSQSQIPNFNSEPLGLNSENIYYSDTFSGTDRISGDNSLTYGFNTGLFNENTGEKLLDLSLGQKYRVNPFTTNINGEIVSENRFSDIYTNGSLIYENNRLVLSHALDTYNNKTNKFSFSYSYSGNLNKVFGLNYLNDGDEHMALNSVFPVNERIHLLGALSKNLNDKSNKGLIGLGYKTCCWEARIVKFESSNNLSEKSLNFELVFKDLASTSPYLEEKIKAQIPNYFSPE